MGGAGVPAAVSVTRLILPRAALQPGRCWVPAAAARHARVARVGEGEAVELLDLDGGVGVGVLAAWARDGCWVEVARVEVGRGEPPAPLVLALGILHTAAFEWAVEKATELGATEIVPLLTRRVQGARHEARVARWQRVAEAAVAQCGRARAPSVVAPEPLDVLLGRAPGQRLLAQPGSGRAAAGSAGATVLVGPEGGFTEAEEAAALAAGFAPLALGPRVLRAETAAAAALTLAQHAMGWLTGNES